MGSAAGGSRLLFGPLAALSVDQLGFKVTGLIGTMICIIAMVICYLSKNFILFGTFYGLVMGAALSFLYLPGKYLVRDAFSKCVRLPKKIKVVVLDFRNNLLCIFL